jgi:hypothetical protein
MNLPHVTYRSYESGRSMPPLSLYERLLSAQLDASYIATGKPAVSGASEHAAPIARMLRKQAHRPPEFRSLDEALNFLKKLQQSEVDGAHQERFGGKSA